MTCNNNPNILQEIVNKLKIMLDEHNIHAKFFIMAAKGINDCLVTSLKKDQHTKEFITNQMC